MAFKPKELLWGDDLKLAVNSHTHRQSYLSMDSAAQYAWFSHGSADTTSRDNSPWHADDASMIEQLNFDLKG